MKAKHPSLPPLILMLFILLFCTCSSSFAENLLENSDFEMVDDSGLPEGWYTDAYILEPGYTVFSVKEGENERSKIIEINNIGKNDSRFAQVVPVEPDSLYCLSGYILADHIQDGHGANLSIEGVYAFSKKVYDTQGKWVYIEYYGETGPDQEYLTVFARLGGYSGESSGKACFDNLQLVQVDSVPGDEVADLWFNPSDDSFQETDEAGETEPSGAAWPFLVLTGFIFSFAFAVLVYRRAYAPEYGIRALNEGKSRSICIFLILITALALRLVLSACVEGYLVDVNCFLSWGHTMASHGPAEFYRATNFCDYPPLYTYILGFNAIVSRWFDGGNPATRIVFRLIPVLCDLTAAWILYRFSLKKKNGRFEPCSLLLFIFLAFNPATIINSAAWGQMDSVLCLLLLLVAMFAVNGRWTAALPVYVVSVLVKPQALMLGPLGLTYIIISWIKEQGSRKKILIGTCISLLVLAAGILPFSPGQDWDWIIQLYQRTLGSYPYATVNTSNIYYLLGGNWTGVMNEAPSFAALCLSCFCLCYGLIWHFKARKQSFHWIEILFSLITALWLIACAIIHASWAVIGTTAMVFSFLVVLSPAIRSGNLRLLPYLGGLLYVLLYVFGIKMHERYLFPAILLFSFAFVLFKDRRIMYLLCLFSFTLFVNEGIVLDNSIRLGSELGHLNSDTVWLADILSVLNIIGSVFAVLTGIDLQNGNVSKPPLHLGPFFPVGTDQPSPNGPGTEFTQNRKLHWNKKDTILVSLITVLYALVSLLTLGSTKAPQTSWTSSSPDEQIIFDLGGEHARFSILYFGQVSRNDFVFSVSRNSNQWSEEIWAQMDQGQCWKWKYVTLSYPDGNGGRYYHSDLNSIVYSSGRYVKLSSKALGLTLNEVIFRDESGQVLPAKVISRTGGVPESELYSDPAALLDEQDTLEGVPAFPVYAEGSGEIPQPGWWNSTYFDEIYHARTAYEFLKGTVPYETSHPPLGKVLMSWCVAIFGMTPFGWRFAGALAGIFMLPGMYLLGKQLSKKTGIAVFSCLLMTLDCMHLTQSQIATIDSFPVLFIIFAYFFMLRFLQTDFLKEKSVPVLINLAASGLFMGLSIASKWIGIYAGAGLAVLFFWHCFRIFRLYRELHRAEAFHRIVSLCLWCILFFVFVPIAIYLVSYIPYFAYNSKRIKTISDYINEVWRAQIGMFNYHSTKNLGMDHPFYSPWWEWPIIRKPMYYASEMYVSRTAKLHHSIFCFGNPVVWFGGLAALSACIVRRLLDRRYQTDGTPQVWHLRPRRTDYRYVFIAVALLAQYLPWVLVPRGTYIYHYFASLPFLMLSIGLFLHDARNGREEKLFRIIRIVLIITAAIAFAVLFPYATGIRCSSAWLDIGKRILSIWY